MPAKWPAAQRPIFSRHPSICAASTMPIFALMKSNEDHTCGQGLTLKGYTHEQGLHVVLMVNLATLMYFVSRLSAREQQRYEVQCRYSDKGLVRG